MCYMYSDTEKGLMIKFRMGYSRKLNNKKRISFKKKIQ